MDFCLRAIKSNFYLSPTTRMGYSLDIIIIILKIDETIILHHKTNVISKWKIPKQLCIFLSLSLFFVFSSFYSWLLLLFILPFVFHIIPPILLSDCSHHYSSFENLEPSLFIMSTMIQMFQCKLTFWKNKYFFPQKESEIGVTTHKQNKKFTMF